MASRAAARRLILAGALRQSLRGRRHPPEQPRRILVAHHLLLGDTLMLTPLLAKLRAQYPGAEVVMTTPRAVLPLYAGAPYEVRARAFDPRDPDTVRALLADPGYDLACVPGDNRHAWLARALGARWVVAFSGDRPAWKNAMCDELRPYPDQPMSWGDMVATLVDGPAPAAYRAGDWPAPPCAPFEPPASPYVVLHLGASSGLKHWPPERWRLLAEALAADGFTPVWSAGRGEEGLVARADPEQRWPSLAGRLDLAQLWHLLAQARLLVCPDTGIAHLARLTQTPSLTLFGPGSAVICGPGRFWQHAPGLCLTQDPFPCRDQTLLFRRDIAWVRRCGRGARECAAPRCMDALGLEAVLVAARHLLAGPVLQSAASLLSVPHT